MSSIVSVKCIQNYRLHVMTWPGSRKPKMSSRVRVAQTHKCCVLPMVPKNSQVSRRFVSPWIGFVNTYIEDCWKFWKTQKKIVRSLNCGEGALLYGRELFILYRFNHSLEPLGVLNDNDGDNRKTHIQSQNIDTTIEKKKLSSWGDILTSLDSWRLQGFKNALDSPQDPVVHWQTQKKRHV